MSQVRALHPTNQEMTSVNIDAWIARMRHSACLDRASVLQQACEWALELEAGHLLPPINIWADGWHSYLKSLPALKLPRTSSLNSKLAQTSLVAAVVSVQCANARGILPRSSAAGPTVIGLVRRVQRMARSAVTEYAQGRASCAQTHGRKSTRNP